MQLNWELHCRMICKELNQVKNIITKTKRIFITFYNSTGAFVILVTSRLCSAQNVNLDCARVS